VPEVMVWDMFDIQPVLFGERIGLRPLKESDWPDLFAVASDPLLWALHPASDRYQEPVFRRFFAEALASRGALVAIEKSGKMIGSSRYNLNKELTDQAEIGWSFLARSHWGGGFNREVKLLMLRHAFRFVAKVYFRVGETNLRSRRAMEKLGGVLSDRKEMIHLPDGTPVEHVVYEITRDQFVA
jgi:RimJ/RimL family protein N-acetyltransferase